MGDTQQKTNVTDREYFVGSFWPGKNKDASEIIQQYRNIVERAKATQGPPATSPRPDAMAI